MIKQVGEYILAKIEMTECMQKEFKQLCHTCKKYPTCKLYRNYVETWLNLQNAFLEENKDESDTISI